MYRVDRGILFLGLATAGLVAVLVQPTTAAFQGIPKTLPIEPAHKGYVERLQLDRPALPPIAHTIFCLRLPKECETKRLAMRHGRIALNDVRRAELVGINRAVNRAIRPQHKSTNVLEANWVISPSGGDCNDYAVTKRHQLQARGWPTSALLLAEVITTWGEHHLVLVVSTREEEVVLDNLTPGIRRWADTDYRWVRMQSPTDPKLWYTLRTGTHGA